MSINAHTVCLSEDTKRRLLYLFQGTYLVQAMSKAPMKFLPVFVLRTLNLTPNFVGTMLAIGGVCSGLGSFAGGIASDRSQNDKFNMICSSTWVFTSMTALLFLATQMKLEVGTDGDTQPTTLHQCLFLGIFAFLQIGGGTFQPMVTVAICRLGLSWGPIRAALSLGWGFALWIVGALQDRYGPIAFLYVTVSGSLLTLILLIANMPSNNEIRSESIRNTQGFNAHISLSSRLIDDGKLQHATKSTSSNPNLLVAPTNGAMEHPMGESKDGSRMSRLRIQSNVEDEKESTSWSVKDWFTNIIRHPIYTKDLFNLFVMGMFTTFVENFLFVYMKERYPSVTDSFLGRMILVTTLAELPVFINSEWFVKELGISGLFILSHFCYFLRVSAYVIISDDTLWLYYFVEISHAFVFACMWIASVEVGRKIGGEHNSGIMQSTVGVLYFQAGPAIGSPLCSHLFSKYGWNFTWHFASVSVAIWSIIYILCTIGMSAKGVKDDDAKRHRMNSQINAMISPDSVGH